MNAAQRREKILQQLHGASAPISASALAAKLGVSRQIVVGDVALLRAGGAEIEATPRGYQFHPTPGGYTGILACVHRTAEEMGLKPYYLYRQKHMVNNLENIGYTKPGFESLYNILMMEERQSIYGLGVGSSSKYVCLDGDFNPRDLILYNERIEEIIQRKVDKIRSIS